MSPRKQSNENYDRSWSDGMSDEANEDLPSFEDEESPEESALHIIDPMDENPDAEGQHTEQSDAIPHDFSDDEPDSTKEATECAHPSCHCQVTNNEYCCSACEGIEKMEQESCDCTHSGCDNEIELQGLQEM